jgi:hypothetical protein
VDTAASVRELREPEKHRTEVTEATEGDWVGSRKLVGERRGFCAGTT